VPVPTPVPGVVVVTNPLLKALVNATGTNCGPRGLVRPVVGRTVVVSVGSPKDAAIGASIVLNALLNAVETVEFNMAVPDGMLASVGARLTSC
jgi:hypothetical protein